MTDLVGESNSANRDHSIIQVREEGERCATEISDVGNQTLSGNETNKDELLESLIEKKLPQEFPKPDPTCIFRVPNKLGRDNENAFVPQVVAIGPYHHGGKKFEAMEQIKLWNLQCLLKRKRTPDTSLVKFVKEIRSKEEFLRNCYDEKLGDHLSSDQFVEMMVVDGCFILELIRDRNPISRHHDVFSMPGMLSIVQNDLFLLENQLPWKVLDCLFNLTNEAGAISLHRVTRDLICKVTHNPFFDLCNIVKIMDNERETRQFRHLLGNTRDLLVGSLSRNRDSLYESLSRNRGSLYESLSRNRDSLYESLSRNRDSLYESLSRNRESLYEHWTPIPSVTHLEESGVKFQPASFRTELLGITFNAENGVMEIPLIKIGAHTEYLFRNLIAYEWCSMKPNYILSYATLLNQLIKSTEDLDSLFQKDIVVTYLSKEDTVSLFNRLCNDTTSIPIVYSRLTLDVCRYNRDRWLRRWLAGIKRDYLYNPRSVMSLFSNAVILALILTALQTVYSVLAYYKQS